MRFREDCLLPATELPGNRVGRRLHDCDYGEVLRDRRFLTVKVKLSALGLCVLDELHYVLGIRSRNGRFFVVIAQSR
jgi:hypothetical protein